MIEAGRRIPFGGHSKRNAYGTMRDIVLDLSDLLAGISYNRGI
jgi:hypothetical protein